MADIPFNTPFLTGKEVDYIYDAYANGQLAGDGKYTKLSSELLQSLLQVRVSADAFMHRCIGNGRYIVGCKKR